MTGNAPAGRYTLVEPLGSAGRTWLARDTVLHRDVAITRIALPPGPREARDRVLAAARTAAGLSHPALVTVHDVLAEPAEAWIVGDHVRGRSLDRIVREAGPLPPGRVATIGLRVLDALAAVHGRGLAHHAVAPANVLIAETGEVVLAGFGLAPDPRSGPSQGRYPVPQAGPGEDLRALGATLLFAAEGRPPEAGPPRPGPLAHVIHTLTYGPHDTQAIRAALTTTATAGTDPGARTSGGTAPDSRPAAIGGPPGADPATNPSAATPRGAWPIILAAVTVLAVVTAAVILLRPGQGSSVIASPTPEATATPTVTRTTPAPATSRTPDPCTLVVPGHRSGSESSTSCSVRLGEAQVVIKTHPDVATARRIFAAIRKRQGAKAGTLKVEGALTTRTRAVPGLGDEGFAQDASVTIFPSASSGVWLRIGARTVEIDVRNSQTKVTADMRTAAMSAARTVAARLKGAS